MRTILIPVDLSPATRNAAYFAIGWAQQFHYDRILLFRTIGASAFEYIAAAADYSLVDAETMNAEREKQESELRQFCTELQQAAPSGIQIEAEFTEQRLLRGVLEMLRTHADIELVAIGSIQGHADYTSTVSDQAIALAKVSPVKLLQIPANAQPVPIRTVLVPIDLGKINTLQKLDRIRNNPRLADAKLLVLNVATNDPAHGVTEAQVHEHLEGYDHELFQSNNADTIAGILDFSAERQPDLLIALPGSYSFLYALTHKSLSQAIYRHARVPVLILK